MINPEDAVPHSYSVRIGNIYVRLREKVYGEFLERRPGHMLESRRRMSPIVIEVFDVGSPAPETPEHCESEGMLAEPVDCQRGSKRCALYFLFLDNLRGKDRSIMFYIFDADLVTKTVASS